MRGGKRKDAGASGTFAQRLAQAMESLISSILGDYFALFFKNFDIKRDLSVKLGKGEAYLNNLRASFWLM